MNLRALSFLLGMTITCIPVNIQAQSTTTTVDHFNKVIVSPHIQVSFKKSSLESVVIEHATLALEKINIEVKGRTLRIYLEHAKITAKTGLVDESNWKSKRSIYHSDTVNYCELRALSLRGEHEFVCESLLDMDKLRLKVFGEASVRLQQVDLERLRARVYGESSITIESGSIDSQKFTAYGESEINTLSVQNRQTKLMCYGEGDFKFNVSDQLKVSGFGEATVSYQNRAELRRGILIGGTTIERIQ